MKGHSPAAELARTFLIVPALAGALWLLGWLLHR